MVILAHLADTHLGYAQYGLKEREEDLYNALEEAFTIALNERVDAIVMAGDVFHTPRPSNKALLTVAENVQRAAERGVRVLTVMGEHDQQKRKGDVPPLFLLSRLTEGLVLLDYDYGTGERRRYVLEKGGLRVVFYGARALPRLRDRVERYLMLFKAIEGEAGKEEGKRVFVGHLPVEGPLPASFEPSVPPAALPKGFAYHALGHVHARFVRKLDDGSLLAYAGSIDILSRGEISDYERLGKGFFLVDLSSEEPLLHSVNLSIRPQYLLEGKASEVLEALSSLLRKPKSKSPIVHIKAMLRREEEQTFRLKLDELTRGRVLDYRLELHRLEIGPRPMGVPGGGSGEVEVITSSYRVSKEFAMALVALKDCLAMLQDPLLCEEEIENVLKAKSDLNKLKL